METTRQISNLKHLIFQEMEKNLSFYPFLLCKGTDWSHGQGTEKDFLLGDAGIDKLRKSTNQTRNLFQMMLNIHFRAQGPECFMAHASSTRFSQGQHFLLTCRWTLPSTVGPGAGTSGKTGRLGSYARVYTASCAYLRPFPKEKGNMGNYQQKDNELTAFSWDTDQSLNYRN